MKVGDMVRLDHVNYESSDYLKGIGSMHGDSTKDWYRGRGVIVRESDRTNEWGGDLHRWWWVLCDDGRLVEEVEGNLELV